MPKDSNGKEIDWSPKQVPQHVKQIVNGLPVIVSQQFYITMSTMASAGQGTGDGALHYLHGWFHKRFSGQYCMMYEWAQRRDGQGTFLLVRGIGRKNGNGNDYDEL